jgi:Zn-dependent protease with chaperone function
MPTGNTKSPLPAAETRHVAALFAIERAGTLALLAALLIAGPRIAALLEDLAGLAAGAWLILPLTLTAAMAMRLTLPLWCRLYPGVRPAPGYFRQSWPDWAYSLWVPLLALGVSLHHPAWLVFLALPLLAAGLLVPRLSTARLLRRLASTAAANPPALPPQAVSLLQQAGLTAEHVRLDPQRPDLVAWTPPTRRSMILLGPPAVEKLAPDELAAAIAHELGHLRLHHAATAALLRLGGWLAVAAVLGMTALAALPAMRVPTSPKALPAAALAVPTAFLLAALLETLALPLAAALGRRQERQANAWALAHLADVGITSDAFISMLHKVHALLGRPAEPPRWYRLLFGDYPSLQEALAHARRQA